MEQQADNNTSQPYDYDPITLQPLSSSRVHSYLDLPHPLAAPYIDTIMHLLFGQPKITDINSPIGAPPSKTPLYQPMPNFQPAVAGMSKGKQALVERDPFMLMRNMLIGRDPLLTDAIGAGETAKAAELPPSQYVKHDYTVPGKNGGYPTTHFILPRVASKSSPAYNVLNILARKTGLPVQQMYDAISNYVSAGYPAVREVRKVMQQGGEYKLATTAAGNPIPIQGVPEALKTTEVLSSMIENSPTYQGTLYRSELAPHISSIPPGEFKVGGQFEAPVLSFSTKIRAKALSGAPIYVLEPGAKAFPTAGVSPFREYEALTGGRFVITKIENPVVDYKGEMVAGRNTIIRIKQLDPPKSMMTPPGFENLRQQK